MLGRGGGCLLRDPRWLCVYVCSVSVCVCHTHTHTHTHRCTGMSRQRSGACRTHSEKYSTTVTLLYVLNALGHSVLTLTLSLLTLTLPSKCPRALTIQNFCQDRNGALFFIVCIFQNKNALTFQNFCQDRNGALFFISINVIMASTFGILAAFVSERNVFGALTKRVLF